MITVYLETSTAFIRYKDVDNIIIDDFHLYVCIGSNTYCYDLNELLTYDIRKDKNNDR